MHWGPGRCTVVAEETGGRKSGQGGLGLSRSELCTVTPLEGFEEVETEFWLVLGKMTEDMGQGTESPRRGSSWNYSGEGWEKHHSGCLLANSTLSPLLSRVLSPGNAQCVSSSPCGPCLLSFCAFPSPSSHETALVFREDTGPHGN